jgi:hypothetical protein
MNSNRLKKLKILLEQVIDIIDNHFTSGELNHIAMENALIILI